MDGRFSRFEIVLRQKDAIYRPGDLLTGQLMIELVKPITLKGIKLQFKGRACWAADMKKQAEMEQIYFDREFTLLERPPGRNPGDFPWVANRLYTLPFECPLPRNCPTSYENPSAFIRYFCRATLEQSSPETNVFVMKRPFTMLAPPPQSLDPSLLQPVAASEAVSVGSFCCRGKLTAEVSLTKGCFVPGETIYGSVNVNNKQSRQPVEMIECRLIDQTVNVQTGAISQPRVLMGRQLDKSTIQTKSVFLRDSLALTTVPSVAASTLYGPNEILQMTQSNIIQNGTLTSQKKPPLFRIEYALQVICGPKLMVTVPLVIGNVPLSLDDNAPTPTGYRPFGLGPQNVSEIDEKDKRVIGSVEFAPLYPVFENTHPTTNEQGGGHTNGTV